jgi:hypothetical protein
LALGSWFISRSINESMLGFNVISFNQLGQPICHRAYL